MKYHSVLHNLNEYPLSQRDIIIAITVNYRNSVISPAKQGMNREGNNAEGSGDSRSDSYSKVDQDYLRKIKELQIHLDKVNNIVRPGCSPEVLNVALGLVSGIVNVLSSASPSPKLHSSL